MSDLVSDEAQASDAQVEEQPSGSEHFDVGDLPPGADSSEPASVATETDIGDTALAGEAEAATPPSQFFTFKTADGTEKQFSSADDAQQFFASWNGRLSKAEKELGEVTRLNMDWQSAYNAGDLKGEPSKTPDTEKLEAAARSAEEHALKPHDWQAVKDYIQKGEGEKALQYIQWRNGEFLKEQVGGIRKDMESRFEEQAAPAKCQAEVSEAMSYVAAAGQAAVNDMGEPMFPEFQDGETYDRDFVVHFRDIWLGQDYRHAADPSGLGFKSAYYEAKATFNPRVAAVAITPAQAVPAAVTQAAAAPRNPDGTFMKRNQALAMSQSDGSSSGAPSGRAPSRSDNILGQLRDVGTSRSKHFAVMPD